LFVLLAFPHLSSPAFAQPTITGPILLPGDAGLEASAANEETPTLIRGGNTVLAVWSDGRTNLFSPPPWAEEQGARDIYAARLDAAGNLIDEVPFVINDDFGYQILPRGAWNGENWLVIWESQEPTQYYYASTIQAVRVAPDGTVLDSDPINVVRYQNSSGAMYDVTSNGSDWLVVVEGTSAGENDLVGVRIAADGTVLDSTPRILVPAEYYLYFAISVHFAGGEYLLTYDNLSDFRARRYSTNLTALGTFTMPGLALESNGTSYYLAWISGTTFVGSPMTKDGIRTFPSGIPIASAPVDGIGVGWDGLQWWFAANEYTQGITLRRISAEGTVIDGAGIPADPSSATFVGPFAVEGSSAGALVSWQDNRAGGVNYKDVRLGFVSTSGSGTARGPIALAAPAKLHADITEGPDQLLVAFRRQTSGMQRIQVQRLSPAGIALDQEPIDLASGSSLSPPAAAWNGSVYFVVWSEGSAIFGKRMLPDGTILDPAPIQVMGRFSPDVAAVGDVFLVVGIDLLNNNPERQVPVARRVSGANGEVLDQQSRLLGSIFVRNPQVIRCQDRWLVMWQRHSSHDNPPASLDGAFVEADGTNHPEFGNLTAGFTPEMAFSGAVVLIAYRTGTDGVETKDVRGLRMLPDGSFPDGTGGFVVAFHPDEQLNPTVTWDGTQFLMVWDDCRNSVRFFDERTDLYGARVTEEGSVLDLGGFVVANDAVPEQLPALTSQADGRSILAASLFRGAPFASYRVGTYMVSDASAAIPEADDGTPAKGITWSCPNPFSPGMSMSYWLAAPERVSLRIFNAAGALIATRVDGAFQPAGEHRITWDGTHANGRRAARGVYFVQLNTGMRTETRRITLLR
jgi:hypothetical protein